MHRNSDLELQNESAAFTLGANALARVPLSSCPDTITPTCLRLLYETLTYVPRAILKNKLGVAGYLQEFVSQSDLTWFLARFRSDAAFAKLSIMTVNGGINDHWQEQLDKVRPMLPQRGKCGCNISTCRLTLTSDAPSRSPTTVTRPRTSSIE